MLLSLLISCQTNPTEQKKQVEKKGDKMIVEEREEVKNTNEQGISAIISSKIGINSLVLR